MRPTCFQDGARHRGQWVHACPRLLWSEPPPFSALKKPSRAHADREVFLDLRTWYLTSSLQQSSAFATSFVLGVCGWEKASVLLHLTNTTCLAQGPICLLPQVLRRLFRSLWQCLPGLSGEKSQSITEEQVCVPDTVRPHKPKHRSLKPRKVYCSVT